MSTSSSAATRPRRVLRSTGIAVDDHAFAPVADLPPPNLERPTPTGDRNVDAIRSAAWDEGVALGEAEGRERGYAAGLEQGRDEGRELGYAEGLERARAAAEEAVMARMTTTMAALDSAATQLAERDALALSDIEASVVDLSLSLASAILDREVVAATDPGGDALRRALRLAPDRGDLVVRLHPSDLDLLSPAGELAPGRGLELVADPSVARGGCLIETSSAQVDARIETALDRARAVLEGADGGADSDVAEGSIG